MDRARIVVLGVGFATVFACGPRAKGSESPEGATDSPKPIDPDACWPVTPLRLEVLEHGTEWEPTAILDAQGDVHHSKHSTPLAHIQGDRIAMEKGSMACRRDASGFVVVVEGTNVPGVRYGADDSLALDPLRISVGDDGRVSLGPGRKDDGSIRVVGDVKNARRTAAVLVVVAMAGGRLGG